MVGHDKAAEMGGLCWLSRIGAVHGRSTRRPLLAFAVLAAIRLGFGAYHTVFAFSLAFAVLGVIVLALVVPDLRTADGMASFGGQSTRRRIAPRLSDLSQPALRRVLAVAVCLAQSRLAPDSST